MICGRNKSDSHGCLSIDPQQPQSFVDDPWKFSLLMRMQPLSALVLTLDSAFAQVAAARRTPTSVSRSIRPQSIAVAKKAVELVLTRPF